MLVLSRKKDGRIMIGDDIVITVVEIEGNKIKLGIEAPVDVEIHREEVYREIESENRDAVKGSENINLDDLKRFNNDDS